MFSFFRAIKKFKSAQISYYVSQVETIRSRYVEENSVRGKEVDIPDSEYDIMRNLAAQALIAIDQFNRLPQKLISELEKDDVPGTSRKIPDIQRSMQILWESR